MGSGIDGMDYPTSSSPGQTGTDSWQYYFNGTYIDKNGVEQHVDGVGVMAHLDKLDSEHNHFGVFMAVMFAMTTVLHFMGNYTSDYKMSKQGDVETYLKQILNDNSEIEQAFDAIQNAPDQASKIAAATKAFAAYDDIKKVLDDHPSSFSPETKKSILDSYNVWADDKTIAGSGVFQGCKDNDTTGLVTAWDKLWHGDPPTKDPDPKKPFSVQTVTSPLGQITNTVNGSSATAQSILKWDESNLEQFLAMIHAIAAQVAAQMKAPVTAASSAGS